MNDQTGMSMAYLSRRLYQLALTVADAKWVRSFSTPTGELLAVGITAPTLGVLAAWLGSALALPLGWSLALATILALAVVTPFMLRAMLFSTPTETDDTRSTAPTSLAPGAPRFSGTPDSEGWFGQMENSTSLNDLSVSQLELISELLASYQEGGDLTQPEWAEVQAALDIVDNRLEEL